MSASAVNLLYTLLVAADVDANAAAALRQCFAWLHLDYDGTQRAYQNCADSAEDFQVASGFSATKTQLLACAILHIGKDDESAFVAAFSPYVHNIRTAPESLHVLCNRVARSAGPTPNDSSSGGAVDDASDDDSAFF